MKSRFRLLAVDLDGTLLDPWGRIPKRNREALLAAERLGVIIVLASGRPPRDMRAIYHEIGLTTPLVALNGAVILDEHERRILQHRAITASTAQRATHIIYEYGATAFVQLETQDGYEDCWHVTTADEEFHEALVRRNIAPPRSVGRVDEVLMDEHVAITKLGFYTTVPAMAAIRTEIRAQLASEVSLLAFDDTSLSLYAPGVSKAAGVGWLADCYSISPSQVMAIGDDINDLELLSWAGHGVAMANSRQAVLRVAAATTVSNEECGVAEAIERWILNEVEIASVQE